MEDDSQRVGGRPRLPDVPFEEPSPEEIADGNVLWCVDCAREWPMRLCAPAVKRCVNHARAWWREERRRRRGHYWRLYGLSESQVQAKLDDQGNVCPICERELALRGKHRLRPQLDHCHDTGHPRDFLCARCNRALGAFGDDEALLTSAAAYVRHHMKRNSLRGPFVRPRRRHALKGLPVNPKKPHHILTESGRRVDLKAPDLQEQMDADVEVREAVEAYITEKVSRATRRKK